MAEADGDTVDGVREGVVEGVGETVARSGLGLGDGFGVGVTTPVVGKATVGGGGTSPSESDGNAVP